MIREANQTITRTHDFEWRLLLKGEIDLDTVIEVERLVIEMDRINFFAERRYSAVPDEFASVGDVVGKIEVVRVQMEEIRACN